MDDTRFVTTRGFYVFTGSTVGQVFLVDPFVSVFTVIRYHGQKFNDRPLCPEHILRKFIVHLCFDIRRLIVSLRTEGPVCRFFRRTSSSRDLPGTSYTRRLTDDRSDVLDL